MIKKQLIIFLNTLKVLWYTVSKPARLLIIVAVLGMLALPVFSEDHGFWLLLCGGLLIVGSLSAYIVYRLLLRK